MEKGASVPIKAKVSYSSTRETKKVEPKTQPKKTDDNVEKEIAQATEQLKAKQIKKGSEKKKIQEKDEAKKVVETVSGYCFVYWGLANLVTYLVFHFMLDTEEKHKAFIEYFAFDGGDTNFFQPFRAIMASNRLENLIASAPSLLIGGYYLQKQIGGKRTLKYWQISLLSCFLCLWAFGPHS